MVRGSDRSWADHNVCASLTTLASGEITKFPGKGSPTDKAFSKSASLQSLWGLVWEANRCVYDFVCTSLFPTSSVFRPRLGCGSSATLWAQDRGRTCWVFLASLKPRPLPFLLLGSLEKIEADNHLSHDDVFLPVYSKTQLPAMIPDSWSSQAPAHVTTLWGSGCCVWGKCFKSVSATSLSELPSFKHVS